MVMVLIKVNWSVNDLSSSFPTDGMIFTGYILEKIYLLRYRRLHPAWHNWLARETFKTPLGVR